MPALAKIPLTKNCVPATEVPRTDDARYVRIGLSALIVTFVFLLTWAALALLRGAVVANGRLVSASDNKTIGQVLLRLHHKPLQIQRDNVESQLFEIKAPTAATINGFDVVTTGAVINAGDANLEIVPADSQYRIQARISPMDIDALHPGMQAEVRLAAIHGARNFPVIYADLQSISADAYTSEYRDEAYYKALFELSEDTIAMLTQESARLIPGMPVDLYIKTGERTLLDYLTRPLRDLFARALNEA